MKTNLRLESSPFCYVYSKYKIEEINGKRYVMPEEKATKKAISITEQKAFIANNPKAEYDTPQCKNKANVYKSRGKTISRNVIHTDDGIIAKVIKEEIRDRIIKSLNKKK